MKKVISSILFLLFITSQLFAQDKGYLALSLGISAPTGDYASKNIQNNDAGYASTGNIFDLSFGYKLGKNLGIGALLRGQTNPFAEQTFIDDLNLQSPNSNWTIDAMDWKVSMFMFGLYGSFPLQSSKVSFQTRFFIGSLRATTPEITLTGILGNSAFWSKTNGVSSSAFAVLFGAGFKFDVGSKVCLLLNLDVNGASPEFRNVKTIYSDGSIDQRTFTQKIGSVNFGVGVGLRL